MLRVQFVYDLHIETCGVQFRPFALPLLEQASGALREVAYGLTALGYPRASQKDDGAHRQSER